MITTNHCCRSTAPPRPRPARAWSPPTRASYRPALGVTLVSPVADLQAKRVEQLVKPIHPRQGGKHEIIRHAASRVSAPASARIALEALPLDVIQPAPGPAFT